MRSYYVYTMTSPGHTTLYTGITNNLERRVFEHRNADKNTFTGKYNISKPVWYQETPDVLSAITEEKRIKAGSRKAKIKLIEMMNPKWDALLP